MKVSEITLNDNPFRIETRTDAYRICCNWPSVASYIDEYGDVEVVYDDYYRVYTVPAFAADIAKYTTMKAADCAINGCE